MKTLLAVLSSLLFLGSTPAVLAAIPSLVGTWDVQAEGAFMLHGAAPGKYTHWSKGQTKITGVAQVLSQNGRVIKGILKLPKGTEPFIAVIGTDGKFYLTDEDGFLDGRFVNKNRMEGVYRHANSADSVVCNSVWTRRK